MNVRDGDAEPELVSSDGVMRRVADHGTEEKNAQHVNSFEQFP